PVPASALAPVPLDRRHRIRLHRVHARGRALLRALAGRPGVRRRDARGADPDLGADDRSRLRRAAASAAPLAFDPVAAVDPGRTLRLLPLLRGPLRRLLRVLHAAWREAGAVRPLRVPAGPLLEGPLPPGR